MSSPLLRILQPAPFLVVLVPLLAWTGCSEDAVQPPPLGSFDPPDLIQEWGSLAHDVLHPYRMVSVDDDLLVMEFYAVKRFSPEGRVLDTWGLRSGEDMALGEDGNLYVSTRDRYVKVYTREGRLVREWLVGEPVEYPLSSQLWGIDLDAHGNVHVVDRANRIVHVFTAQGSPVRTWGMADGGFDGFESPSSLLILSDGGILVADRAGYSTTVLEFSENGQYRGSWSDQVAGASGLLQLHDGTVVVANRSLPRYSREGEKLGEWGLDENGYNYFHSPTSLAETGSGTLIVGDIAFDKIVHFDATGHLLKEWRPDWPPGQFRFVRAVEAVGDFVYTLESESSRIQKFTRDGVALRAWGEIGSRPGQFYSPDDLAVDDFGVVYVVDVFNGRITRFSNDGDLLGSWKSWGTRQIAIGPQGTLYTASKDYLQRHTGDGEYMYSLIPKYEKDFDFQGLDVGASGRVYVVDALGAEVHVFGPKGEELNTWPLVDTPDGDGANFLDLTLDREERVIIAHPYGSFIDTYTSGGWHLGRWSGDLYSTDPGNPFKRPRGVDVDAQGNLWIVDSQRNVVQHFDP